MGKQYSFKTTRRTSYLEPILDEIDRQDRSEVIRQAVILGFIQMGKLDPSMIPMLGLLKMEPMVHKSPTIVPQKVDESPTTVAQTSDKIEPSIEAPEIIEIESVGEDLESKLNNIYD